jgi:hypothetical protein
MSKFKIDIMPIRVTVTIPYKCDSSEYMQHNGWELIEVSEMYKYTKRFPYDKIGEMQHEVTSIGLLYDRR